MNTEILKAIEFYKKYGRSGAENLLDQLDKLGCSDDFHIDVIQNMWVRSSSGFRYKDLKEIIKAHKVVSRLGGLAKSKEIIECNDHGASYYCNGSYYRYGAYDIQRLVGDKFKVVHGGMESDYLTHTSTIESSIRYVELCASSDQSEHAVIPEVRDALLIDPDKQMYFEKNRAESLNIPYGELKESFDSNERLSGERYAPSSENALQWIVWSKAWDVSQKHFESLDN